MRIRSVGGFTLIEVLVAILLLAVGVVGASAVQVAALRTRHATGLLSGGVQLAGALADRMRANSAQMHGGDGANPYLQLRYDAEAEGAPSEPAVACFGAASCNSAQLAAFDLYEIKQALFSQFPGGRVAVCRDAVVWTGSTRGSLVWECGASPNAPIVIKVGWRDRRADPSVRVLPSVALVVAGAFP